jgi:hypothetical protein
MAVLDSNNPISITRAGIHITGSTPAASHRADLIPQLPGTQYLGDRPAATRDHPGMRPMEELAPQTYCQRAALELAALIRHQRKPSGKVRRDSALLRRCVEQVLAAGALIERLQQGPWSVGN